MMTHEPACFRTSRVRRYACLPFPCLHPFGTGASDGPTCLELCHISDLGPHLDPSVSEHFPDSTQTHHYPCVNKYSPSLSFILLLYDFLSSHHYSVIPSSIDYLHTLRPLHTIPLDTIII